MAHPCETGEVMMWPFLMACSGATVQKASLCWSFPLNGFKPHVEGGCSVQRARLTMI